MSVPSLTATPPRNLGLQAFVLAVFVLLLSWLYLRADALAPSANDQYLQNLRELRELDARIDGEVLANHQELTRNYDALTRHATASERLADELRKPPAYLAKPDADRVAAAADELMRIIRDKLFAIDNFKRENAVLRNSLAYFPVLGDDLLLNPKRSASQKVTALASHYTRDVLTYARTPTAAMQAELEKLGTLLGTTGGDAGERALIRALSAHGEIVVTRTPRVNEFINQILSAGSSFHIEELHRRYESGRLHAEHAAARHRIALYFSAILLLGYLAWTFLRLERARRSLQQAHQEISARYAAQMAAERQLRLHATAFSSAQEGIMLTDAHSSILDVNPAFSRITGYSRDEVLGQNPSFLNSGRQDPAFYAAMWKCIQETGSWRGEIWNRNKLGEIFPELLSISAVRDATGALSNYVAVFADIGRIKAQEAQLAQIAYYDALTNLPNRVLLADRISQAIAQTRRSQTSLAICYLDLDGFKPINDAWGHDVGDHVLVEIAGRLQQTIRGGDTVARLGGDEFVLLLGMVAPSDCDEAMGRILQAIYQPFSFLPESTRVTASIGVTLFPADSEDADTLLRHADQAMYQAKLSGKNRYHVFDAEQDRSARSRHDRVARIQQALEDQEFVLYFQPKVSMRTGAVIGAEALIRWVHPERGIVAPAEFLPLIENDDLIKSVGDWVIETALFQMETWRDEGISIPVSVNIAGKQLQSPEFVDKLRVALFQHPSVADMLELEVLETAALEDVTKTSRVIEQCRQLGVHFSLDDFGTGYSSLTYLKRLPADTIKIDQSFVREILSDHNNLVIVQGVVGLASAFGRTVIAEGVETPEHGRLLLQLNCDYAQGYGVSKPIPGQNFVDWYREWKPDPSWQRLSNLRWQDRDFPLMAAEIQLRAWVAQVLGVAQDRKSAMPEGIADVKTTPFAVWFSREGKTRFASPDLALSIESQHSALHAVAQEIANKIIRQPDASTIDLQQRLIDARDKLLVSIADMQMAVALPRDQD